MTFEEEVAKYLKRPEMQAQVKAHFKSIGGGGSADIDQVNKYAQEAIHAIVDSLPIVLRTGHRAITYNDLNPTTPLLNDNGDYEVELHWNPKAIHRESLCGDWVDEYKDGLQNIVALYSTGYHSSDYVYGWWSISSQWYESVWIRSRRYLTGQPFIQIAVAQYNAAHAKNNVVLVAPKEYY